MSRAMTTGVLVSEGDTPDAIGNLLQAAVTKLSAQVKTSDRIAIWDTLELNTETNAVDDRSFSDAGTTLRSYRVINLTVTTIKPEEAAA